MKTASFQTYKGPGRVSIARYAPRNTPAGYRQFKALAPGPWFNSVTREEYEARFAMEILGPLDPQKTLEDIQKLANGAEPVLLCWEKPPFTESNWCHRRIVADWFKNRLGVEVPELGYETDAATVVPAQQTLVTADGGEIAKAARAQRKKPTKRTFA